MRVRVSKSLRTLNPRVTRVQVESLFPQPYDLDHMLAKSVSAVLGTTYYIYLFFTRESHITLTLPSAGFAETSSKDRIGAQILYHSGDHAKAKAT